MLNTNSLRTPQPRPIHVIANYSSFLQRVFKNSILLKSLEGILKIRKRKIIQSLSSSIPCIHALYVSRLPEGLSGYWYGPEARSFATVTMAEPWVARSQN